VSGTKIIHLELKPRLPKLQYCLPTSVRVAVIALPVSRRIMDEACHFGFVDSVSMVLDQINLK
jgi:hypothetical protein